MCVFYFFFEKGSEVFFKSERKLAVFASSTVLVKYYGRARPISLSLIKILT